MFRSFSPRCGLHTIVLLFLSLAAPFAAQASVFTAGSFDKIGDINDPRRNYNWHNALNWEPEGIPTGEATIPADKNVFLTQSATIGTLNVAGGINGHSGSGPALYDLTVTQTCNWTGGQIGLNYLRSFNISSGASLNLTGAAAKWLVADLNNAGTINWSGTGTLATSNTVTNTGAINITAEFGFFGETGNGGIFNNSGTVIRSAGSGVFAFAGHDGNYRVVTLNNTGSLQVQTGTVQIGPGRSTGTFNASSGAVLRFAGHEFDATPLNGAGIYRFEPFTGGGGTSQARGNIVRTGGNIEILGGAWSGGFSDVPDSSATLSGNGKLLWQNGYMPGNWTFAPDYHVEASGSSGKGFDGSMVNRGTFDWLGGGPLQTNESTFVNEGTFNCKAAGRFLQDTYINTARFENRGTFNSVANGENSTDDVSFVNSGTLNIGGSGVGVLRINSYFNQTSTGRLRIDIGGSDAALPQFDQLPVGVAAGLTGALNINFINDFSPQASDVFRLMTANSFVSGTFSNVAVQNLPAKTVVPVYGDRSVDLVVQPINLSINDVSVLEGNTGTTNLNFTVTLSQAASEPVTVNYATVNSTATQPGDYTSRSGTLTIPAGQTRGIISVSVVGDTLDEVDEGFFLNLSAVNGAALADNQGRATIIDNDATPSLSINDVLVTEGNANSTSATFTITLSAPSGKTVSVNAIPADGTARTPGDYVTGGAQLIFAPGETSKTFSVPVKGDAIDEANELFYVFLSSPVNASINRARGTGTIDDDDAVPTISIDDISVKEYNGGQTTAALRLRLSAPSGQVVKVSYVTENGTALTGSDYVAVPATQISFSAGNLYAYARVLINGDELNEANETFKINLNAPVNGTIADGQATGTILNDDSAPALSINDVQVEEGNEGTRQLTFTVTLSKASGQAVSVNYTTANGTALAGSDYTGQSGTLTFASGSPLTQSVSITIVGDAAVESDETLYVFLSSAANASISKARGVGTITNDDVSG